MAMLGANAPTTGPGTLNVSTPANEAFSSALFDPFSGDENEAKLFIPT